MRERTVIEEIKDSRMNDIQEISGDLLVCDSSSRLVPTGLSRSCFTEDVVTFVNAGCEGSSQAESGVVFLADDKYQGGDIVRTDECIIEGGDYPFVYRSARFGDFSYQFNNLPPGDYFVELHFAEIIYTYGPKGIRVFNVIIQDEKEKGMRPKSSAKYEKKIEELTQQCQRKTDECYQAWMSLTAANEQLEKVRMELDNRLFQSYSLDQTLEKQDDKLKAVSSRYEHDKKFWMMAISGLEEKIKNMKEEHAQLAHDAHECADSIPEFTNMVSAVQMLVAQCEEFKQKFIEE